MRSAAVMLAMLLFGFEPLRAQSSNIKNVPEDAAIAHLVFTSEDNKHQATFSIVSSESDRQLFFTAGRPLPFSMKRSWKNFWK